ncbi:MAG: hypothetical protein ACSLE0_13365 [Chitinophagaceae bacterium]
MKVCRNSLVFTFIVLTWFNSVNAQQPEFDSTGHPGDNFSLQGALEMFRKSGTPEEFEKLINSENNHVNNLDLNGDGETDYIRVIDKSDKDLHALVLQVSVSESESQDIAVIEIEKTGENSAILQIIGDEDIYGKEIIIEPEDNNRDNAYFRNLYERSQHGPSVNYDDFHPRIIVNVWLWPSVRFIYAPVYRPWISPWKWRHYPAWWRPWRPLAWHSWHPRRAVYHRHFAAVNTHRVGRAHSMYRPSRVSSLTVRNQNVTRTRATVTGPRGNKLTRKTTTVRSPRGKVRASKTTVRKRRR